MKLYICTDMEGCAGILNHDDWVLPTGRWYNKGISILTAEVNAAIAGFFEGGATEIVVLDGHGAGGIDPLQLDERARLLRGQTTQSGVYFGLDGSFQGLAFVGQHAKAGTPRSHITHTGWFNTINETINGISVGEFGEIVLCAAERGIPTIFGAGEQAFTLEAQALTPGVITVAVKEGLLEDGLDHLTEDQYRSAKLTALHLHPHEACRRIRAGARQAAEQLVRIPGAFHSPSIKPPFERIMHLRAKGDQSPWTGRAIHPTSVADLLRLPLQR